MTDSEFQTLCMMAATIRAGKAGKAVDAWSDAIQEAVMGYGTLLSNRASLDRVLTLHKEPDSQKPLDTAKELGIL